MRRLIGGMVGCLVCLLVASAAQASVSGNPLADGWALTGNSLANGVYVQGDANYGFDAYSAGFTVQAGSNLHFNDGALSWLPGDTVLGVGGQFNAITPGAAGWGAFSGGAVNALLPAGQNPSALRLQAKFGTSAASWATSTVAPGAGDGNGSSSSGGGRVQVRTSSFFGATLPTPGQTEPWTWSGNSGQVLVLDKDNHIDWAGISPSPQPSKKAARMIWNYDAINGHVSSWQLLLNASLLDRILPGQLLPSIGDQVILTVQHGNGDFTNALVNTAELADNVIPEPTSLGVWTLLGITIVGANARKRLRR